MRSRSQVAQARIGNGKMASEIPSTSGHAFTACTPILEKSIRSRWWRGPRSSRFGLDIFELPSAFVLLEACCLRLSVALPHFSVQPSTAGINIPISRRLGSRHKFRAYEALACYSNRNISTSCPPHRRKRRSHVGRSWERNVHKTKQIPERSSNSVVSSQNPYQTRLSL